MPDAPTGEVPEAGPLSWSGLGRANEQVRYSSRNTPRYGTNTSASEKAVPLRTPKAFHQSCTMIRNSEADQTRGSQC